MNDVEMIDVSLFDYDSAKYDEIEEIDELVDSVKEFGVIQPIIVECDGDRYQILAGLRRLKAAKLAGLEKVPVKIVELTYSEYRELFDTPEEFEKAFGRLSEEKARALICTIKGGTTVKACAFTAWKEASKKYK